MFTGSYTALVTPFREGQVDYEAFEALINHQAEEGIDGIVPVGTTGESPTVDASEHIEIIRHAVQFSAGRLKVVAGTGANSTSEAIYLTREAEKAGVDGSLQVCPYYNKPSQEGLYQHFKAIAEASSLPLMLYSVPGRSVIQIDVETVARLANDCETVVSIKEAGGSSDRVNKLVQAVPADFTVLSGDDPLTVPFMSVGAAGVVSVAANLIPGVISRQIKAALEGSFDEALEIQKHYYPLLSVLMTLDTNPIPIKSALALCGRCTSEFRLPLVGLTEDKTETLKAVLSDFDLL
ncbi:MAG: 4-hydroxy-tetrahydrodipicolinate synthase [Verrucomicrobiaceae bacterium]|jgi:4-hydroxy-tetrahydrodipicolinate synthase|nr:4-hydroxy-tetrahydrodipicolinate synthase [Verrucomicrobiaceae bacterium]